MMIKLFKFIKGFLVISFTGENAEELLNIAAKNRINIWGLYCKKQCFTGCLTIKDFKRLKDIKRGKKIKVKIVKKCGLPFKLKGYNGRIGLILGAIFFSLILYFLSGHIWVIDVEGNSEVSKTEIIKSCCELGITEGMRSVKINSQNDAQRLLLKRNDIAWASLNIEGCRLTVNITEIKQDTTENKTVPTNLKASRDGVIKRIDVTSGDVIVKTEDVVKKGDILVSGVIERLSSTVFVYSSGKIIAETERTIKKSGEYIKEYNKLNGKVSKRSVLSFFGVNIPLYLGTEKRENNSTTSRKNIMLFDKRMPIHLTTVKHNFIETKKREYTKEELSEILTKKIENEIKKLPVESYIEKETLLTENETGVTVSKTIICRENIAYQDEIILGIVN